MKPKPLIARCLWTGALLTVPLLVAVFLWWGLGARGDVAGAAGAKGVAFVVAVCWGLNFVTLVVLLAVAQLSANDQPPEKKTEE